MSESKAPADEEKFTPEEIARWAEQEIALSTKACELRVREAKSLADRFSSGEISAEAAGTMLLAYGSRWGDAMHGVYTTEGLSDERILATIDETRRRPLGLSARRDSRSGISIER